MQKPRLLRLLVLGLALISPVSQADLNLPTLAIHGALAQGFVQSWGNDVISDSLNGSNDLMEVVINGRTTLPGNFLVSGQLLSRRNGTAGEGKIRVDYLQVDKQLWLTQGAAAGLRFGRVKNPYGLYNVSRGTVFSRPGITLPASVYFESSGLRNLFFSADAVQPYGYLTDGNVTHEFSATVARDFDATEEIGALTLGNGQLKVRDFRGAQWMSDGFFDRHLTLGLSYLSANLAYLTDDENDPFRGTEIDANLYVFSARWQAQYFSLVGEYRFSETAGATPQGHTRQESDGGYVQLRAWKQPGTEAYLRYDLTFADTDDRSGRDFARQDPFGTPAHTRFSRHHVLGFMHRPDPQWGLFAEYQYVDGTEGLGGVARNQPTERYWQALYLMIAYRF